jgi:hypothetical protein
MKSVADTDITRRQVGLFVGAVLAVAVPVAALAGLWVTVGPVDTIVYSIAFGFGLTFLPGLVLFGAPSFPGFLQRGLGGLYWVLGATAFGATYLVQRAGGRFELWPGTRERVFIHGTWHDIVGGQENLQILGWQPFGFVLEKADQTLEEARVDPKALAQTQTDGGSSVERGGYAQRPPDASISGDETWLVDLKRVYSRGLQKIGDIEVIERAEEIATREESQRGRSSQWSAVIGSIVGLIIGIITGVVFLGGL